MHTLRLLPVLLLIAVLAACGSGSTQTLAVFSRTWDDGRVETLSLYPDGRVLMDHMGTIDRVTISSGDVDRLAASLSNLSPAADPAKYPRLTLTADGRDPVVIDPTPGSAGELFLSLLDRHRLP